MKIRTSTVISELNQFVFDSVFSHSKSSMPCFIERLEPVIIPGIINHSLLTVVFIQRWSASLSFFVMLKKIPADSGQKFIAEMIIKHPLVFPALIGEIQILFRKILMHFWVVHCTGSEFPFSKTPSCFEGMFHRIWKIIRLVIKIFFVVIEVVT